MEPQLTSSKSRPSVWLARAALTGMVAAAAAMAPPLMKVVQVSTTSWKDAANVQLLVAGHAKPGHPLHVRVRARHNRTAQLLAALPVRTRLLQRSGKLIGESTALTDEHGWALTTATVPAQLPLASGPLRLEVRATAGTTGHPEGDLLAALDVALADQGPVPLAVLPPTPRNEIYGSCIEQHDEFPLELTLKADDTLRPSFGGQVQVTVTGAAGEMIQLDAVQRGRVVASALAFAQDGTSTTVPLELAALEPGLLGVHAWSGDHWDTSACDNRCISCYVDNRGVIVGIPGRRARAVHCVKGDPSAGQAAKCQDPQGEDGASAISLNLATSAGPGRDLSEPVINRVTTPISNLQKSKGWLAWTGLSLCTAAAALLGWLVQAWQLRRGRRPTVLHRPPAWTDLAGIAWALTAIALLCSAGGDVHAPFAWIGALLAGTGAWGTLVGWLWVRARWPRQFCPAPPESPAPATAVAPLQAAAWLVGLCASASAFLWRGQLWPKGAGLPLPVPADLRPGVEPELAVLMVTSLGVCALLLAARLASRAGSAGRAGAGWLGDDLAALWAMGASAGILVYSLDGSYASVAPVLNAGVGLLATLALAALFAAVLAIRQRSRR